jgi:lysophospholipase L1-like esterase
MRHLYLALLACFGLFGIAHALNTQITHPSSKSIVIGQQQREASSKTNRKVWRIMPVGDSLTEGSGATGPQSYRGHLFNMLKQNGYNVNFVGYRSKTTVVGGDPDHGAYGGYTIGPDDRSFCPGCGKANIYDNLDKILAYDTDVILLLIGINDLLPSKHGYVAPSDAPKKLEQLVKVISKRKPKARIIVSSMLKVGWTDTWPEYAALNAKAREIGERSASDNIYFVNLNNINLKENEFTDKLHLTNDGAKKVAEGWYKALTPLIKK